VVVEGRSIIFYEVVHARKDFGVKGRAPAIHQAARRTAAGAGLDLDRSHA
jgi:hypothetical protein